MAIKFGSGKTFRMKGEPMVRNFGIGEKLVVDNPGPLDKLDLSKMLNSDTGMNIRKALAAGMTTLPGGFNAFAPKKDDEETEDKKVTKPEGTQVKEDLVKFSETDSGDEEDFNADEIQKLNLKS